MQKLTSRRQTMAALAIGVAALAAIGSAVPSRAADDPQMVFAQAEKPSAQGTVNSIDADKRKLNITHGPVAALHWPGMTMDFGVASGIDLGALKAGSKIKFTLGRGEDGMYVIDGIEPAE
jgi:Cu(I)/Ag(I) efflux system protein CusF